jgi:hypothetical protein
MQSSGCEGKGRGRQGWDARGRAGCGQSKRARDDVAGKLDLEAVVASWFCIGERHLCCVAEDDAVNAFADQNRFGRASPPGFGSDTTERDPRRDDSVVLDPK